MRKFKVSAAVFRTQFLYLLLNNRAIRDVIETVGKKAILILGRFDEQRKPILETIRSELRRAGLVPILFDFEGPRNRDITETVSTLAHLARAVIADLSEARSVPQELMTIIPNLPSVPLQPIIVHHKSKWFTEVPHANVHFALPILKDTCLYWPVKFALNGSRGCVGVRCGCSAATKSKAAVEKSTPKASS